MSGYLHQNVFDDQRKLVSSFSLWVKLSEANNKRNVFNSKSFGLRMNRLEIMMVAQNVNEFR